MADGGRAESNWRQRYSFTSTAQDEIDRAAHRLARAFGYGPSWRTSTIDIARFDDDNRGDIHAATALKVAHRGRVEEGAARSIGGSGSTRQQHSWSVHGGKIVLPYASPDMLGQAALSYAATSKALAGPLLPLLKLYALEDAQSWAEVDRFLAKVLKPPHERIAGLFAMERLMLGHRAVPIDTRAAEYGIRAETFRKATRDAESVLMCWLVMAARAFNKCANARSPRLGHGDSSGIRSETFWHPERSPPGVCRIYTEAEWRTAKPSANDMSSRALGFADDSVQSNASPSRSLPIAA